MIDKERIVGVMASRGVCAQPLGRSRGDKHRSDVFSFANDRKLKRSLAVCLLEERDAVDIELGKFRNAHSRREKKFHDRTVTQSVLCRHVWYFYHTLHILRLQ